MRRHYWLSLSYATFGIITIEGVVKECAPIANWMKGKKLIELRFWLMSKKAKVIEL